MPLSKDMLQEWMKQWGGSQRLDKDVVPKVKLGDEIIVRNINPVTHTRLPRYIRGKRGKIDRDCGVFVFPDTVAHDKGENPQHVYSVRFTAQEVWGPDAPSRDNLYIDLWEDYIEPA